MAGWDGVEEDENFVLQLPTNSRSAKNARLVEWNVEMLVGQLKRVIAQRSPDMAHQVVENPREVLQKTADTPYEEVVEAFQIPKYGEQSYRDSSEVELDPKAIDQLRQVVTIIADKYRDNAFHNFEHASHVTMSGKTERSLTPKLKQDSCQQPCSGLRFCLLLGFSLQYTSF